MEMVVEKQDDAVPEVQAKQVCPIQTEKMAEDLKPMDTDKESLTETKSPEESIQEDSGSDIAPMQTDEQLKQVLQSSFDIFKLNILLCAQFGLKKNCLSVCLS